MKEMHMETLNPDAVRKAIVSYSQQHQIKTHDMQTIELDGHNRIVMFDRLNKIDKYQVTIKALITDELISPALILTMELKMSPAKGPTNTTTPLTIPHPSPRYFNQKMLRKGLLHIWRYAPMVALINSLPIHDKNDTTYYSDNFLDKYITQWVKKYNEISNHEFDILKLQKYLQYEYQKQAIKEDDIKEPSIHIYRT